VFKQEGTTLGQGRVSTGTAGEVPEETATVEVVATTELGPVTAALEEVSTAEPGWVGTALLEVRVRVSVTGQTVVVRATVAVVRTVE
jgi:hypothetical protein